MKTRAEAVSTDFTRAGSHRQKLPIRQKALHERADFADYGMAAAMAENWSAGNRSDREKVSELGRILLRPRSYTVVLVDR
jgi:hypothetical protein